MPQHAQPGSWSLIGPEGAWKHTRAGTVLDDYLFTTETNGGLYVTDLENGQRKQIGGLDFGNTALLFAANEALYTIETSGDLFHVNPVAGSWNRVGKQGDWKDTVAGTIFNDLLFTVDASGALYGTDLETAEWEQVGGENFSNTALMFAADRSLYTIEKNGDLFRVNPNEGNWTRIGRQGDWQDTLAGATLGHLLFTIDASGALYATDLHTAEWDQLGGNDFAKTALLFAAGDALYTIETTGSLYRINL